MTQTLEDLGRLFRAERERRGLSVDYVAEGLKISTRILYALEAGDSASLPHIVYVRGFVNAYAKYLELDIQDILANLAPHEGEPESKTAVVAEKTSQVRTLPKINISLIILICVCVAGGSAIWYYRDANLFSSLQSTHFDTAQPAPALSSEQKETVQVKPTQKVVAQTLPQGEAQKPNMLIAEGQQEKTAPSVPKRTGVAKEELKKQEVASSTVNTLSQVPAEHTGPHKVIITALRKSTVQSVADKTGERRFSLNDGDTFALTFDTSLRLTLSDVGAVSLRYNGKAMPKLGNNGEKKTVVFPPTP